MTSITFEWENVRKNDYLTECTSKSLNMHTNDSLVFGGAILRIPLPLNKNEGSINDPTCDL